MAVNFGDTIIEGGIEPSVKVQSPVQDNSAAVLAQGQARAWNEFGGALSAIGGIAGSIFKANQEAQGNSVLVRYENDLLDLADAVEQGTMKTNEAMVRARNIRRQYLGNSPALQTDFDKIWTNFVDTNGLGNVLRTGTQEQQAQDALTQEAFKLGYPSVEAYRQFQTSALKLQTLNTQLDTIKASGGIISETQRLEALSAVTGLANSAFPAAQKQIIDAQRAIEANPNNKAQIVEQLNLTIGSSIAQLDALGANADTAYITDPIKSLMTTFNQWANNEIENTVLENGIKYTQLQYESMFANDPTLGPFIAQSKLLNSVGLADSPLAQDLLNPQVIKALRDATDPTKSLNIINNSDDSERFTQSIIKAAEEGLADPAAIEEFKTVMGAVVDGVYENERTNKDGALGYKGSIEVLGNPAVKELLGDEPIPAAHADKFVQVIQDNYERELVPVIQKFWESVPISDPLASGATGVGVVGGIQNIPMNQLLDPVWNGNAVEFIPKPEYASNPRIQSLAADVNSGDNSIGIPLNNLINAYAYVSKVDAKTIYEQDFAGQLFGLGADGQPVPAPATTTTNRVDTGQEAAPETFTIGDFNAETLEPTAEYTAQNSSLRTDLPPIDSGGVDDVGVDFASYLPSIRAAESGGDDSAKNPLSTATGRYQFLRSTWNDLVNRYPNSGLTYEGRLDPQQQEVAIRLFTAENARQLQANGIGLNNGTLYAAHFLGSGDAVQVLNAPNTALVSSLVPKRVVDANPFLRGWDVADFKAWVNRKGNG